MSETIPVVAFQHLTWNETMLGLPTGPSRPAVAESQGSARAVLDGLLQRALEHEAPIHVLFSGGRDSSTLLALAVHVARQNGLPEPIPVSVRHPDSAESDESSWQEIVLAHLGVRDHLVIEMHGEQALLADAAQSAIRRRGVVWPPAVQGHGAIYQHLAPGVIISGEGGDMVIAGHRMEAVRAMCKRPNRTSVRRGLRGLQPAALTRLVTAVSNGRRNELAPTWLRGPGRRAYISTMADMVAMPLRWDAATRRMGRSRSVRLGMANFAAEVGEYGSISVNPFADLAFGDALARDGGAVGMGNRTAIFRRLFGDLLPDEILARTSKAAFNSTRWGERERDFAREWDGTGFDEDWIDAEALRRQWLSERPHPIAGFLLQVAWAISQGIPVAGEQR